MTGTGGLRCGRGLQIAALVVGQKVATHAIKKTQAIEFDDNIMWSLDCVPDHQGSWYVVNPGAHQKMCKGKSRHETCGQEEPRSAILVKHQ